MNRISALCGATLVVVPHAIVVGALLRGGRVLVVHRRADRRFLPDRWDLPGGHVEPGERPTDALVRELREELGVEAVVPGEPSARMEHRPDLDDGAVVDVRMVREWRGEPANLAEDEHDDLRWVDADEVSRLDLALPASATFLRDLLTGLSSGSALRSCGQGTVGRGVNP